jgi:hypothetical protein
VGRLPQPPHVPSPSARNVRAAESPPHAFHAREIHTHASLHGEIPAPTVFAAADGNERPVLRDEVYTSNEGGNVAGQEEASPNPGFMRSITTLQPRSSPGVPSNFFAPNRFDPLRGQPGRAAHSERRNAGQRRQTSAWTFVGFTTAELTGRSCLLPFQRVISWPCLPARRSGHSHAAPE